MPPGTITVNGMIAICCWKELLNQGLLDILAIL
jgi:hypothetical protein